ncbi:hypothetical protein VKT23_016900 [Stygiomarasmius scandens]|uniref:CCHC-type domain-containing protein n=1 Tax=Marasmiellus scandens TaxID=2682957 RepID=A0ABR1ITV1_9AGAR
MPTRKPQGSNSNSKSTTASKTTSSPTPLPSSSSITTRSNTAAAATPPSSLLTKTSPASPSRPKDPTLPSSPNSSKRKGRTANSPAAPSSSLPPINEESGEDFDFLQLPKTNKGKGVTITEVVDEDEPATAVGDEDAEGSYDLDYLASVGPGNRPDLQPNSTVAPSPSNPTSTGVGDSTILSDNPAQVAAQAFLNSLSTPGVNSGDSVNVVEGKGSVMHRNPPSVLEVFHRAIPIYQECLSASVSKYHEPMDPGKDILIGLGAVDGCMPERTLEETLELREAVLRLFAPNSIGLWNNESLDDFLLAFKGRSITSSDEEVIKKYLVNDETKWTVNLDLLRDIAHAALAINQILGALTNFLKRDPERSFVFDPNYMLLRFLESCSDGNVCLVALQAYRVRMMSAGKHIRANLRSIRSSTLQPDDLETVDSSSVYSTRLSTRTEFGLLNSMAEFGKLIARPDYKDEISDPNFVSGHLLSSARDQGWMQPARFYRRSDDNIPENRRKPVRKVVDDKYKVQEDAVNTSTRMKSSNASDSRASTFTYRDGSAAPMPRPSAAPEQIGPKVSDNLVTNMSGRRMPTLDELIKEARTLRSGGPLSSFANTVDKNDIPANQSWTSHSYGHATQHNDPYRVYRNNNNSIGNVRGRGATSGNGSPPDDDGDDDPDDNGRGNSRGNNVPDPRRADRGNHNISGNNNRGNGPPDGDPDPNGNGVAVESKDPKDPRSVHSKTHLDSDSHAFNTHQWQLNAKISLSDVPEWDGGPLSIIDYIAKMNELAHLSPVMHKDLGLYGPFRFKEEASTWWLTLSDKDRSFLAFDWTHLLAGIKEAFLTTNWVEDRTIEFNNMRFRQRGRERETPVQFLRRKKRYCDFIYPIEEVGLELFIKLLLKNTPKGWLPFISPAVCPNLLSLQKLAEIHKDTLIEAWKSTRKSSNESDNSNGGKNAFYRARSALNVDSTGQQSEETYSDPEDESDEERDGTEEVTVDAEGNVATSGRRKRKEWPKGRNVKGVDFSRDDSVKSSNMPEGINCYICTSPYHWARECKKFGAWTALRDAHLLEVEINQAEIESQDRMYVQSLTQSMASASSRALSSERNVDANEVRTNPEESKKSLNRNQRRARLFSKETNPDRATKTVNRTSRRRLQRLAHSTDQVEEILDEGKKVIVARKYRSFPEGLGSLGTKALHAKARLSSLEKGSIDVKLDSGADITLMSEELWKSMPELGKPKQGLRLRLYQLTSEAKALGYVTFPMFMETEEENIVKFEVEAYVVKNMKSPLLLGEDFQTSYELGVVRNATGLCGISVGRSSMVIPASTARSTDLGFKIRKANVAKAFIRRKSNRRSKARAKRSPEEPSPVLAAQDTIISPGSVHNVPVKGSFDG